MSTLFASSPKAPMSVDGMRQEVDGLKEKAEKLYDVTKNQSLPDAVSKLDALIDELTAIGNAHQAEMTSSPHRPSMG